MLFEEGIFKAATIVADVGKGKSCLLGILARYLAVDGIKKTGFINDIPGTKLLSYQDLNFQAKISFKEAAKIMKYFFIDETNFMIPGVDFLRNRVEHKGVERFQQICRHLYSVIWISATRGNHVWIALREMVNYYVFLGGIQKLFNFGHRAYYTLNIKFRKQNSFELAQEFKILVSDQDFALYDTYWLADMNKFRIGNKPPNQQAVRELKLIQSNDKQLMLRANQNKKEKEK